MINILSDLYIAVAVMLLFGASIFLHELGHFLMARWRGLKIEGFAIGFGPKIFGWTRNGIDYAWRWIPAGGYVKLPQMITSEALEGSSSSSAEPLPPITPWSKILVSLAGPFMNVVLAFAVASLIYFVGLPVTVNPSIIGYVDPASPEARMGIQQDDRIVQVDGHKVTSWEDVQADTILARSSVIPVVIERNGVPKTYQLTATVNNTIGLKMLNLDPRDHALIAQVNPGTPAEAGGLKAGDEVVSIDKIPVYGQQRFVELIQARPEKATEIVVMRNKQRMTFTVTPALNPGNHKGIIGAMVTGGSAMVYRVQRPGPTPWSQIVDNFTRTVSTFGALLHSKETGVGAKDLSGPVGIISMLAVSVHTDYRLALNFLVLLNVNLAMINLLPLPVLDGGHILMSVIEWIRRRPISLRFMEYATMVFAALLISFILYVSYADIKRIPLFRSMLHGEVVIEQPGTNSDALPTTTVKP